jgi:hypothetical protein
MKTSRPATQFLVLRDQICSNYFDLLHKRNRKQFKPFSQKPSMPETPVTYEIYRFYIEMWCARVYGRRTNLLALYAQFQDNTELARRIYAELTAGSFSPVSGAGVDFWTLVRKTHAARKTTSLNQFMRRIQADFPNVIAILQNPAKWLLRTPKEWQTLEGLLAAAQPSPQVQT